MASGKLRRKLRKKLGLAESQPVYKKTPTPQVKQAQTAQVKSCCGRAK